MPISAHDVAALIRTSLPDVGDVKLHKLLYYCQGFHLAHFDEPLFVEPIKAWDMGPVVSTFRAEDRQGRRPEGEVRMAGGQLNTIGYVVSHYGKMTGRELVLLTHAETPWKRADEGRPEHGSVTIKSAWLAEFFKGVSESDRRELVPFDRAEVAEVVTAAAERRHDPVTVDRPEDILAWTGS